MRNENDQAIAFLKKELKGPLAKNYEVRMTYGRLLMNSKHMDEAREQFQTLNKQHPDIPDVLYALGLLDLQTDHLEDGERHFKRLIELGERRMEASYHLGLIAEFKQEPEAAIKWFSAVTQGQFFHHSQLKLASLLSRQGKADDALDLLHELATEIPQEKLQIYLLEGEILYQAKRYQEAYDLHDRALEEMPEETRLLYGRAMAAERLNLLEKTEADLTTVLSLEPNNVQALNGLGYTLADRTERYEEAYNYLQRAIELSPEDPAVIDSMGWVLYRMGRHQDAIQHIQRAYDALKDPEVAAHLGEVLWANGQHDKARQVWDDALQHAPDHNILLDTMKRFGQ
jgi:tetratricopeptide (TPR) repeat protein